MKIPKIKLPDNLSPNKLFSNKKFNLFFSVIVAFAIWLIIMINQNPDMERTFTNVPVNINLENTYASENNLEIIGDISEQKFTVVVGGPSYVVGTLKLSDLYVYASAATVNEPGEYKLTVAGAANTVLNDYRVLSVSPQTVTVNFDYVDTKEFTIKPIARGASAVAGLIAETPVVSGIESGTVTIKGPRSVMSQIETVEAYAVVNSVLSESKTYDAELRILDAKGEKVDTKNLTLSTEKVSVTVPVSKKKTVNVIADFTNLPAGFNKESIPYEIDHKTVTIIGKPDAINKITSINLSAIDISSVSKTANKFDVSAKLPEGVRLLDTIEKFTVTIDINNYKYSEKTVDVSKFDYTNLGSGLKVTFGAAVKGVKICGPSNSVRYTTSDNLRAKVDLSNLSVGEHTVTLTIKSTRYNNVWQVGTYSTTVKITK